MGNQIDEDRIIEKQLSSYLISSATFTPKSIAFAYDSIGKVKEIEEDFLDLIKKDKEKRRITEEEANSNLSEAYKKKNLVFVLGAGISSPHKIVKWDDLLLELLAKALENDGIKKGLAEIYAKMYLDQFSKNKLITARYIRKHIGKNKFSLERETLKILYKNVDRRNSPFFDQLLEFCKSSSDNSGIDSIITYNYDDLIETFCDNASIEHICRFSKKIDKKLDSFHINHVHGYLSEGKKKFSPDDHIVLSEETYHEQYSEIYKWSNLVQLDKFMNNTCLFIGLSFTDPNMRRLLDIAFNESSQIQKHYYINIRDEEEKRLEIKERLQNDLDIRNRKIEIGEKFDEFSEKLIYQIYRFEEEDLRSFGIETIWIKDWNELPKILEDIRK